MFNCHKKRKGSHVSFIPVTFKLFLEGQQMRKIASPRLMGAVSGPQSLCGKDTFWHWFVVIVRREWKTESDEMPLKTLVDTVLLKAYLIANEFLVTDFLQSENSCDITTSEVP